MKLKTTTLLRCLGIGCVLATNVGAVQAECPPGGVFPNQQRWAPHTVTVIFNPTLDPALERAGFGNAATRIACFQSAVDAWNDALQAVAPDRLTLEVEVDSTGAWAADRDTYECDDPPTMRPVDDADYALRHTDSDNAASTGNGSAYTPVAHGWITGSEIQTYRIDQRLGECKISPDGTGDPEDPPVEIEEADILWFTHLKEGSDCERIEWDYRGFMVVAGYDFYSVMLHELGHLLGLMHQEPDGVTSNVMRPSLTPGTRSEIQPGELDCLASLYAGDPVPVRQGTWGQIKLLYR